MPDDTPIDVAPPAEPKPTPKPPAAKPKAAPKPKPPAALALSEVAPVPDVQTSAPEAPAPRRWRVDLPQCCQRIVEGVDEAAAFDAFCAELGITGSQYTPTIVPLN